PGAPAGHTVSGGLPAAPASPLAPASPAEPPLPAMPACPAGWPAAPPSEGGCPAWPATAAWPAEAPGSGVIGSDSQLATSLIRTAPVSTERRVRERGVIGGYLRVGRS
ncbi:MAG: hypothetical protein EOO70_02430, partial [Myxococcaceae bacterium]